MDVLTRAAAYLELHGRLIDRLTFAALFAGGQPERALDALRCYQNTDGGFGNALEPDLRGAGSQPEPVEVAFHILDSLDAFDDPMVPAACDYLLSVTAKDGGVPFVLPSVRGTAHAVWWEPGSDDPPGDLVPTAGLAALLHKHGVEHAWLAPATDFCWSRIALAEETTPYHARAVVAFLEHVPDRARAEAEFARLRDAVLATVAFDPAASGDAQLPAGLRPGAVAAALVRRRDPRRPPRRAPGGAEPGGRLGAQLADVDTAGGARVGRLPHRAAPANAARLRPPLSRSRRPRLCRWRRLAWGHVRGTASRARARRPHRLRVVECQRGR
ncbi:hypothetical protein [Nonomuraea indica]|uniref:Prenyltransferase and squalene oxidase repeat-containing protein n=1 Tax=Nonomuraea indica TaxID=1581193 RepID=A0ABW8AI12_9ACTN